MSFARPKEALQCKVSNGCHSAQTLDDDPLPPSQTPVHRSLFSQSPPPRFAGGPSVVDYGSILTVVPSERVERLILRAPLSGSFVLRQFRASIRLRPFSNIAVAVRTEPDTNVYPFARCCDIGGYQHTAARVEAFLEHISNICASFGESPLLLRTISPGLWAQACVPVPLVIYTQGQHTGL